MEQLLYKRDWAEAKQRYGAWWRGEKMDRCLMWVTAPRAGVGATSAPRRPATPEGCWTDLEYLSAVNDYEHERTFYGGEAYPVWSPGYAGQATIPSFYDAPLTLDWDTGWFEPILTGDKLEVSGLQLNRAGRWWQFSLRQLQHAKAAAVGKSIPAMNAIYGVGDTLGVLRGNGRLLYDMMDDPAGLRDAELRLMDDWAEVFRLQAGMVRDEEDWYATWFALWAPGWFYPMQCDVAYGISPRTFRECYGPALRRQAEVLDYAVYHVDGVGAFPLVEEVCRIERVAAVQILPGAGKPSPLHYLDVLRLVQGRGKRLHISLPPEEVEAALSVLSARGLCLCTRAASEAEARRLIDLAGRLSVDRG